MNDFKQKWKDFAIWVVEYYGYENLQISNCTITCRFYFGTNHRHDLDNYAIKFLLDGLVDSGVITDDSMNVVNPLLYEGYIDKKNPRMEVLIIERKKDME